MAAATPEGAVRIGLGHGAVTDFASDEGSPGIIPPDRAARSGLDYLAIGDWHGQMQVGPATWYAGTPEADGFKHSAACCALLVTLDGTARVRPVETGSMGWQTVTLDLLPGDDPLQVRPRRQVAIPARLVAELDRAAKADPLAVAAARALIADPLAAHLGNQLRRLAAWNLALTDLQLRRAAREGKVLA